MVDTGFNPRPELIPRAAGREPQTGMVGESVSGEVALAPLARIAPTEEDLTFRNTNVRGVVHDENAYAMGGVAGHAGLFSTARDLARFAHLLLTVRTRGGGPIVSDTTVERFTSPGASRERALGWELAPGGGRIAAPLSPSAFGHTGFTGTSLWVDPARDLYVVLLTNRVNPTREGRGITQLRRDVHALAVRAAGRASGARRGGRVEQAQ